jgi:hypothetical protein
MHETHLESNPQSSLQNRQNSNICPHEAELFIKKFTYDELLRDRPTEVDPERLELYLSDEDLMEYLGICREFLEDTGDVDLYDRKYIAGLTAHQYLSYGNVC